MLRNIENQCNGINGWSYVLFLICQTLEGVCFAGNGITATGLKAFDGILQSNIMLKTLDLSGNPIGDEGAKVCLKFTSTLVSNAFLKELTFYLALLCLKV